MQIGADTDWEKVDTGGIHTLAVKEDGSLWAWAGNFQGQIGDGTTGMRLSPIMIGSATDWRVILAGWEHSAGLQEDMYTMLVWGWNAYGQLGNGTTSNMTSPYISNPVKIGGTALYYLLIQDAYDASVNTDAVLSRNVTFTGDLFIDLNKSISLLGGYTSGFSTVTGKTIINGNLIISDGKVTIENVILE